MNLVLEVTGTKRAFMDLGILTVAGCTPPTVNVAVLPLVIAGGALTTTVKLCVAFGSVPLVAVSVTGKDPFCVGVPESSPADDSVRPVGSTPAVTLTAGAGISEERRVGKECSELCRSRWSPYH